jgi:hypothetical protein
MFHVFCFERLRKKETSRRQILLTIILCYYAVQGELSTRAAVQWRIVLCIHYIIHIVSPPTPNRCFITIIIIIRKPGGGGVQVFSSSPSLSVSMYDSLGRLIYATHTGCLPAVRSSPCSRSFGFVWRSLSLFEYPEFFSENISFRW